MKYIALLLLLVAFNTLNAQNYILPEGEFMDTTFNLNAKCNTSFPYFYSVQKKYPKSSANLVKDTQVFLASKKKIYSGSGYITFRFAIDCEGNVIQKIRLLQTNEQYQKINFDKELVNDLYAFFKTLDKWEKARLGSGEPTNYIAFITFKIKNGKVINIIP